MVEIYPDWLFVNLDALTYGGNLESLKAIEARGNHVFVKGDITDRDLIKKLFDEYDFDYVINFADEAMWTEASKSPRYSCIRTYLEHSVCSTTPNRRGRWVKTILATDVQRRREISSGIDG